MTNIGLPVPQGFTITTEACTRYYEDGKTIYPDIQEQILEYLDKLEKGDIFMMRVLNETLTYEVDQVLIVLPNETEALNIDPDKDYCTLVTCTPYAVNTHRLLVRGHRIENLKNADEIKVTSDAVQIDPMIVAPIVAAPILIALVIAVMTGTGKRKRKKKSKAENGEKEDK